MIIQRSWPRWYGRGLPPGEVNAPRRDGDPGHPSLPSADARGHRLNNAVLS